MEDLLQQIDIAIVNGDQNKIKELINLGLDSKVKPSELITEGLVKGMNTIGEKWSRNEVFIPQVLRAARAMNMGLAILEPLLESTSVKKSVIVIGSVEGDLHDIGKNLVSIMLKGKGFKVIDLGTDVSSEKFINAIIEYKPSVVAMSALLSTTMLNMRKTIEAIKEANLRDNVLIAVGGAPVTESYCREIGADIYEKDAVSLANNLANRL